MDRRACHAGRDRRLEKNLPEKHYQLQRWEGVDECAAQELGTTAVLAHLKYAKNSRQTKHSKERKPPALSSQQIYVERRNGEKVDDVHGDDEVAK
eukprot:9466633-Pyramimonas_sp.AAC.2